MFQRIFLFGAIAFLFAAGVSSAATIYVPDNYPTIQDAIDAAAKGDTVVVRQGTYVENIDFKGKDIVVTSEMGPEATIIDGNQAGSVVTCTSGEPATAVLEGFTITNGSASYSGGGIDIDGSSPTIRNNIVRGNVTTVQWSGGGGILCSNSSSEISKNEIFDNTTDYQGGGILCVAGGTALIRNNTIYSNHVSWGGGVCCRDADAVIIGNVIKANDAVAGCGINVFGSAPLIANNLIVHNVAVHQGGGINMDTNSAPVIVNNMICMNTAGWSGGGINCENDALPTVTNNTVYGNDGNDGGGIACGTRVIDITNTIFWNNSAVWNGNDIYVSSANPNVTYCCVKGGWSGTGNISDGPLFVDVMNDDYHLPFISPCVNKGTAAAPGIRSDDFEGDPRPVMSAPDIGADEFYYHLYHVGAVVPGGPLTIGVAGKPGAPVLLALGTGIQDPPMPTPYGDLYLTLPLAAKIPIGSIGSDGVLGVGVTVPASWIPGEEKPLQALVGPFGNPSSVLTNLMILEVE